MDRNSGDARRDPPRGQGTADSGRPDFIYSVALFVTAVGVLAYAIYRGGALPPAYGMGTVVLFLSLGLFTIAMGYAHPQVGHVSFDRVAQVAAILVVGPVAAAWLNGLASLIYPWHRLRRGQRLPVVLMAALHNAGLMSLMVLSSGLLYQLLGGPVPLRALDLRACMLLLVLMFTMQALNDLGMRIFMLAREGRLPTKFSAFAFIVEAAAGLGGILIAVLINRLELPVVALALLVMALGMRTLTELARIRNRLEIRVEERTRELSDKTRELERMATHDPLTGLNNRRFADAYLEERIEEFSRYGLGFSVALLDLDYFKRINDHYSHDTGDEVLRRLAVVLQERCRETDMVARYGGEEFLLCFPATSTDAAREACEQIREAVADIDWRGLVSGMSVTVSAGVASIQPGMGRRGLLRAADRALYEAKAAGRNRVCRAAG